MYRGRDFLRAASREGFLPEDGPAEDSYEEPGLRLPPIHQDRDRGRDPREKERKEKDLRVEKKGAIKVLTRSDGAFEVDLSLPEVPTGSRISGLASERNRHVGQVLRRVEASLFRNKDNSLSAVEKELSEWSNQRVEREKTFVRTTAQIYKDIEEQKGLAEGREGPADKSAQQEAVKERKRQAIVLRKKADEDKKRTRAGNAVLMEVQAKLDAYRNDPKRLEQLKQSIMERKANKKVPTKDMIEINKMHVPYLSPQVKREQLLSLSLARSLHRSQVISQRESNYLSLMEHRVMLSKRKEHGMERERELRENWKKNALIKVRRKKWMVLCEIALRQYQFARYLEMERVLTEVRTRQERAALVIQKFYKKLKQRIFEREKRSALDVIRRFMRKVMFRRRGAQKQKSANLLITFLNDVKNMEGIVTVIRQFRQNVGAAQRFWRSFSACKQARIALMLKHWDHIQHVKSKRAHRLRTIGQSSGAVLKPKPPHPSLSHANTSLSLSHGNSSLSHQGNNGSLSHASPLQATRMDNLMFALERLPLSIKRHVIEENLRERRIIYSKQLANYSINKKEWDVEVAKRNKINEARQLVSKGKVDESDADLAPKKPHFKVLPSEAEMIKLMEKAVALHSKERVMHLDESMRQIQLH